MGFQDNDHIEVFMGHIMLYMDSRYHHTDPIKARAVAKKYISHLENHPDSCLYSWLDTEFAKH